MKFKNNVLKVKLGKHKIRSTILNQAKKEGNIIYGGKAIQRKLKFDSRPTMDFDLYSKKPKKSAIKSKTNLNKNLHTMGFFAKKGTNKSTWKVKNVGRDNLRNTKDDIGIADYTKTPRKVPKFFTIKGVKYRSLQEELQAKKKLIKNKDFEFRRKKDITDFKKLKRHLKIK